MFWDKIIELCNNNGISPSKLCEVLNFSNATATKWKNGATPHDSTLRKIINYFGLSDDYFKDEIKKEPTIIPYSGNEKVDSIVELLLNSSIDDNDLHIIEAVLDKYKR